MKKRIWELDAFRGLCLLGVVAVHLIYDLVDLYGIIQWEYPGWFLFVQEWGGVLFILLSGICVTLGSHHIRRGLMVFGGGLVITAVTVVMYLSGYFDPGIIIYFGVLHCLGVCMLSWCLFRRLPGWLLAVLGGVAIVVGLHLYHVTLVDHWYLIAFGLTPYGFSTSDFFPLLPYLGFFLIGTVLGRWLYREKESLFPKVNEGNFLIRFLSFCGRNSLWIYLGHQPILAGICMLISYLK